MAKLKALCGRFVLRTLPIEESFFYSSTGKNFPIYISGIKGDSLTFVELRKKAISNDTYLGSSTINLKSTDNSSDDKILDGHWTPLGNFVKYSRFVGKEILDFSANAGTKKTISLFERGNLVLCASVDLKNINNYKLMFVNKNELDIKSFEYGKSYKEILKLDTVNQANEKYKKIYNKLSSKDGIVSILRVLFKDVFKDLSNKQIKDGFEIYPPVNQATNETKVENEEKE